VVLTAPTSHADVPAPYFATQGNGSDPHITACTDPTTGANGFCMYTSVDMGQQYAYSGNHYPMRETKAYFSPNGSDSWIDKGVVFQESTLDSWVPRRTSCTNANPPSNNKPAAPDVAGNCRAYHLWAPAAIKSGNFYYLYVPDVEDTSNDAPPNISTSSQIAVARSSSPFGPFTYQGTVSDYGYMSDPDVLIDGSDRIIVWADGDNSTCGGIQSALLDTDMRTILEHSRQFLSFSGVQALGDCDGAGGDAGPYIEGASIYKTGTNWTIYFAAKPMHVPTECATGVGGSNTANEVIGWATAASPQGPYTYKGIVMCGSSTEWTNQATVITANNGRKIMVYHDAGDGADTKMRNLHAECLFMTSTVNGLPKYIAGVYRQQMNVANGFNDCMLGTNAAYWGLHMVDPQQPSKPPIIRAPSDGTALTANRYAVGPWERYKRVSLAGGKHAFQALSNGKYLCTPNTATPITASCTSTADVNAQWSIQSGDGGVNIKSVAHNKFLSVAGNGNLYASGNVAGDGATVNYLFMGGKSS
jgi:hypothetical protein